MDLEKGKRGTGKGVLSCRPAHCARACERDWAGRPCEQCRPVMSPLLIDGSQKMRRGKMSEVGSSAPRALAVVGGRGHMYTTIVVILLTLSSEQTRRTHEHLSHAHIIREVLSAPQTPTHKNISTSGL